MTAQHGFRQNNAALWEDLSDYANMVDEQLLEADYFIDQAPEAVFVPDQKGLDKQTWMEERKDPDLYDFDLEAEPTLQVLVGKALELARIEVIQEHECAQLAKMKATFKMQREAMLLETQRREHQRERKVKEAERRQLQASLTHMLSEVSEQKAAARTLAKQHLASLKSNTLSMLTEQGLLASRKQFSLQTHLVAPLLSQTQLDLHAISTTDAQLVSTMLTHSLTKRAKNHKQAI